MDMSWVPVGCDPHTTFRIEVKIDGFLNKQVESRKEYVKARKLNWVVDSDRFSLCELMNNLSEEISWGSSQMPKIWMFDKNEGKEVVVSSDSQITDMFKMYEKEKKIALVILVCDLDGSSHCNNTPPKFPCIPSQPLQGLTLGNQSQIGSSQGYEELNEHVGLDVEELYSDDEQGVGHEGVCHETNMAVEQCVDDLVEQCADDLAEQPSVGDVAQCEPFIAYDPENPIIEVDAVYACLWRPMNGKSQWIKVDPGFKVLPPQQLKRPPGRPKKQRIPGCLETKSKGYKKQQCKRCLQYGHQQRTCKEPIPENYEPAPTIKKRKRGTRNA